MTHTAEIIVPDIGGAENVEVIDILVKTGDALREDDPVITLEGDKATMEVPSPMAGIVKEVKVKLGDRVAEGTVILTLEVKGEAGAPEVGKPVKKEQDPIQRSMIKAAPEQKTEGAAPASGVYAGPGVRRLAHELGVDLRNVQGEGPKGRIIKQDVFAYVKARLTGGAGAAAVAPAQKVDFSRFGAIETIPLSRIRKATAANVHRSWVTVPHVTQFDDADITEMDAFRKKNKGKTQKMGLRLTPLVFIMKAVVAALQKVPEFNASLDADGENLIMKKYFHLGIAVDTPNGLVVPVIRDVDKKSIYDLAGELGEVSEKARTGKLTPLDMAGSCFTISSLGGIGGTAFTPIVNAPDVGILGVSRAHITPVYIKNKFTPRLMLPLSLSYDHRVIDGAVAARFIVAISEKLADVESLII